MAKFGTIFKEETKKAELHPKRVTKWIHYSKLKESKYQYRKGKTAEQIRLTREREEALADLIDADGEVLQDLLVRKIDADEYEIVAGGHRWGACKILVEERGKREYEFLPCIIRNTSEVRTRFSVYSSNFGKKTQYEIMCELEGMKHLLETYPEEFPDLQTGRMVEKLEKRLGIDQTTVGEYLTISNNLGEKGMEKFEAGTIKKSAALALSGLPEEEQEKLLAQGITTNKDITAYKKSKKNQGRQSVGVKADEQKIQEEPHSVFQAESVESGNNHTEKNTIAELGNKVNEGDYGEVKEEVQGIKTAIADYEKMQAGKELLEPCEDYAQGSSDVELAKAELEKARCLLTSMMDVYNENHICVRKQKLIVAALVEYIHNLDMIEKPMQAEPASVQPEFPVMKNNEQRKQWLRDYQNWGLWYEDRNIGCKYYKYDFDNGARLIAEEYQQHGKYTGEYTSSYLHLIGGPEPPRHKTYGYEKWQRNEEYNRYPSNETELIEFLKYIQKEKMEK